MDEHPDLANAFVESFFQEPKAPLYDRNIDSKKSSKNTKKIYIDDIGSFLRRKWNSRL